MTDKPTYDELLQKVRQFEKEASRRKNAEAALRESESKFRSVAQSAKDAIILADTRGKIKFYNAAAQTMFGYPEDEIVGRSLTILMPEEFRSRHTSGVKRAAGAGNPAISGKTLETKAVDKEGREFPIELSFSTWQSDSEFFLTGIVRDISKRKQIEAERDQLIKSLQDSLAKLKTLSGLLPICASCKKIRDDKGYWNRIETYIQEHSEAEFSHGICPECARKLYPSFYD
jgi:PAS domain S-box-containing protein